MRKSYINNSHGKWWFKIIAMVNWVLFNVYGSKYHRHNKKQAARNSNIGESYSNEQIGWIAPPPLLRLILSTTYQYICRCVQNPLPLRLIFSTTYKYIYRCVQKTYTFLGIFNSFSDTLMCGWRFQHAKRITVYVVVVLRKHYFKIFY